ncbi:MAG: LysE family translocator [Halopseudomonas aestusnigri]
MSLEFFLTSIVIILVPGTGAIYTIATGLRSGRSACIVAALGCTLSILPHVFAAAFGLAAVLHTSALLFQAIKFCGVAYLLYLAYQTLKDSGPVKMEVGKKLPTGKLKIITNGVLINVLNPKLSIFFLAFLPQFISTNTTSLITETLVLGAIFMGMTFIIFVIYGLFAAMIGQIALGSERFMRWFRRTTALAFASFGVKLAISEAP